MITQKDIEDILQEKIGAFVQGSIQTVNSNVTITGIDRAARAIITKINQDENVSTDTTHKPVE